MRIILVRHGETTWNIEGRYQGQEDTPLSERGLRQGHLLAEGLHHIPIDVCISSPLQRSYQTCKFCADLHKLPVATDERLLEINHGSWEGVLAPEIAKQFPQEFALWHTRPHLVQMPDGGESLEDVRKRARAAFDDDVAQGDLAVAANGDIKTAIRTRTTHTEDGGAVKLFHSRRIWG